MQALRNSPSFVGTPRSIAREILVRDPPDLNVICLLQMRLRSSHAGGPLGVIRQQQQSLARLVQAADWSDPGQRIADRSSSEYIVSRPFSSEAVVTRPRGLFIIEINLLPRFNHDAIHLNAVFLQMHRSFRIAPQISHSAARVRRESIPAACDREQYPSFESARASPIRRCCALGWQSKGSCYSNPAPRCTSSHERGLVVC